MTRCLVGLTLLLLAACSGAGSTGPRGLDPTVLITNDNGYAPLVVSWYDQSGQSRVDTVRVGAAPKCTQFFATLPTDSVRFVVYMGDTTGAAGLWSKGWSPWFDPKTGLPTASPGQYPDGAEYWTIAATDAHGGAGFIMKAVPTAPC